MSRVFFRNNDRRDVPRGWGVCELPDDVPCAALSVTSMRATARSSWPVRGLRGSVVIGRADERWLLFAPRNVSVSVNSSTAAAGLAVLKDRDRLRVAGRHWLFSTDRRPGIEPYTGNVPAFCSMCRLPVQTGRPVVVCPGCRAVFHQDDVVESAGHDDGGSCLNCWTYESACLHCGASTDLNRPLWVPDEG